MDWEELLLYYGLCDLSRKSWLPDARIRLVEHRKDRQSIQLSLSNGVSDPRGKMSWTFALTLRRTPLLFDRLLEQVSLYLDLKDRLPDSDKLRSYNLNYRHPFLDRLKAHGWRVWLLAENRLVLVGSPNGFYIPWKYL